MGENYFYKDNLIFTHQNTGPLGIRIDQIKKVSGAKMQMLKWMWAKSAYSANTRKHRVHNDKIHIKVGVLAIDR